MSIATATYKDAYAGLVSATLVSTPKGFRWIDSRGSICDGLRRGFSAERMIAFAQRSAVFSNVAVVA